MPVYLAPVSRRRFIAGSFAAATALAVGQGCALPKDKRADSVALLSDIHIAADPETVSRKVNMTRHLQSVTAEVLAWPQLPRAVFVNGDLAFNTGERADYEAVLRLLHPLREAGMPLHLEIGNHDDRDHFWNVLQSSKTVPPRLPGRQAAIVRLKSANWFVLDSLIKIPAVPGFLGEAQRSWLASALDANPDKPALIMIHHQPNPTGAKNANGLEDSAELFSILRPRPQVKAYFFGHTHRWEVSRDESGIHLVNLPATAYPFEAGQPNGWVHATVRDGGARLELRCLDHGHKNHGQVVELAWRDV